MKLQWSKLMEPSYGICSGHVAADKTESKDSSRQRRWLGWTACLLALGLFTGCPTEDPEPIRLKAPEVEVPSDEDILEVQHILIAFKGSLPGDVKVQRSKEEAEKLANELLERAKGGEDFDALVVEYTDDSAPGIYKMVDNDVDTRLMPRSVMSRSAMVQGFGDTSFSLEVGEIGMANYDPVRSQYGYHIIKRLK